MNLLSCISLLYENSLQIITYSWYNLRNARNYHFDGVVFYFIDPFIAYGTLYFILFSLKPMVFLYANCAYFQLPNKTFQCLHERIRNHNFSGDRY